MTFPIKYLSLQKAELQYEVELRGGTGESVQDLRNKIIKLAVLLPPEDILESHLSPVEDLKQVKESLIKSLSSLTTLRSKFDKNCFHRTENLLNHIHHRLARITYSSEVNDVYKDCVANLNSQFADLSSLRPRSPQPKFVTNSDNLSEPSTSAIVSCDRNIFSDILKLKYSGSSCVHDFIQRVDEFVQSREISYERILSMSYEIFTDDALQWYRYNKGRINSWDELCALLRDDFAGKDYDYHLYNEIRFRTQGDHENIAIYLSIMHGMFSRLTKSLSEEEKLDIILHNILPCYVNTLASNPNIKSLDELRVVCKNYENAISRSYQYHEPPRANRYTVAPDFAYKRKSTFPPVSDQQVKYMNYPYREYTNKNNYANSSRSFKPNPTYNNSNPHYTNSNFPKPNIFNYNSQNRHNDMGVVAAGDSGAVFCPRCRNDSHSLGQCSRARFPICFKCGRKDVRYPECPNCNPVEKEQTKN